MPNDQFTLKVDYQLRVAASQLRTLKTNSTQLARTLRKASRDEGQAIEELLAMVSLPEELMKAGEAEQAQNVFEDVHETAMVLYEPPREDKSPLKIFSRILAQKNSGDSEGQPTSANRRASSSSQAARPHLVRQNEMLPFPRSPKKSPKRTLRRQNAFVNFSKAESSWLAEILSQPIAEDCHFCTSNLL